MEFSIPQLTKVLKDLIKEEKKEKRAIPDKPKVPIQQRKDMATPTLGTATQQRGKLDINSMEVEDAFELKSRNDWKK